MPDTSGSLIGRAAFAACLAFVSAPRLFAQPADPSAVSGPDFLTRYAFHLSANALAIDDPRFTWDVHFGGELDLVDYVKGRITGVADYEAILGNEFRAFDPNQSYYLLEVSSSYRIGRVEVAGLFHHVSRHLGDRAKRESIAWNVLGGRAMGQTTVAGLSIDGHVEAGSVVEHAFVDYTWTGDVDVTVRRRLAARVGVFGHGVGTFYGVDGTNPGRGTQRGGLFEGGLRFEGRGGALELFAGVERRVDADPLEQLPLRWGLAGFRFLSK
jgi:hypothetical protein